MQLNTILTVGFDDNLIDKLFDKLLLPEYTNIVHLMHPSYDIKKLPDKYKTRDDVFLFRESISEPLPDYDIKELFSLEKEGVPTIREMIMSDRVIKHICDEDRLAYMTLIQRRIESLIREIKPIFVLGGFDSVHAGIACGVSKKLGIRFVVMNFSVIPKGFVTLNEGLVPNNPLSIGCLSEEILNNLSIKSFEFYNNKITEVPAYKSPSNIIEIINKMPGQILFFINSFMSKMSGTRCKYTSYSLKILIKIYIKKRYNLFSIGKAPLITTHPKKPFVFFGFHMQPESSIDVWGAFFSNQISVVENIIRATPIMYDVLIKVHRSDADKYSYKEIKKLMELPRVKIVSPFVNSRSFIENASIVFAIQGTMGLEGALLGRPVIVFGENRLVLFPTVSCVKKISELPSLVRQQLKLIKPNTDTIIDAYKEFLRPFYKASHNDWTLDIDSDSIKGFSDLLSAGCDYCNVNKLCPIEEI